MEKYIPDILKIGIPLIFGLLSTILAYVLGRRKQIDELKIKKCFEYAQNISLKLQAIHQSYNRLYQIWDSNFSHMDFREAIDAFEKYGMFDNEKDNIENLKKMEEELEQLYMESAVFIKSSFRKKLRQYLDLGNFTFQHDGSGIFDNYYEKFFENLIDKKDERRLLFEKLENDFHKLIK